MTKERVVVQSGFSEKQADLAVDQALVNDQTKASQIFDPQKKNKAKSQPQPPR